MLKHGVVLQHYAVNFVFEVEDAYKVELVGDFTGWKPVAFTSGHSLFHYQQSNF